MPTTYGANAEITGTLEVDGDVALGTGDDDINLDSNTLFVDADNDRVGIGTTSPDYKLDVAGNVGLDEYVYHNGDTDTFIRFEADEINIKAGGAAMILAQEGGGGAQADKVTINDDGGDVDFQVKGDNEANLIRTDAANDRVGIGTDAPDYTLDVAGNAGFDEYIYHNDDSDTFIRFQDDDITIKAGNINCISFTSASQSQLICNDSGDDLDFIVRSPNESLALYLNAGNEVFHINHGESGFKTKIHSTNGEAITVNNSGVILNEDGHASNDFRIESDNTTHMLFVDSGNDTVGVGTSTPYTAFSVVHDYNGTTFENQLSDGQGGGEVLKYSPGADDDLTAGQLYYLHVDGTWNQADADSVTTGGIQLLGVGLGNARTDGVLLKGFIKVPSTEILNLPAMGMVDGMPVYVSTTAGHFDFAKPTGTGDFVRVVGYAIDDDSSDVLVYFNPSQTSEVVS